MARAVVIILILLAGLTAAGLIIPAIYRARDEQEFRRCQEHLRQLGSFAMFHSTLPGEPVPTKAHEYFPSGTLMNPALRPDQRMSWYVLLLSAIDQGSPEPDGKRPVQHRFDELLKGVDVLEPWDAPIHQRLARTRLTVALCPGQRADASPDQPALTNYLGNGGIGSDTAALTIEQAGKNAGVFRYDVKTPLELIRNGEGDGLSQTISLVESARDIGPWLRGGPSTIRGLDAANPPYLGVGRPYAGCHRGKGNFCFADGSVRVLTDQIDPDVFSALLTIQGGDREADADNR